MNNTPMLQPQVVFDCFSAICQVPHPSKREEKMIAFLEKFGKDLGLETLVDKIFDRVECNPKSIPDIRKLMEYYLPTTVKLLEAYAQMDSQPVGGENIEMAKREIEATLDTLNVAFEKLLDSLFQEIAWDVSADISVLNTMLAQEGLTEDGLKKK